MLARTVYSNGTLSVMPCNMYMPCGSVRVIPTFMDSICPLAFLLDNGSDSVKEPAILRVGLGLIVDELHFDCLHRTHDKYRL